MAKSCLELLRLISQLRKAGAAVEVDKEEWKKINIPVFPLLWMVLDSVISFSQPSSCRFWYCGLTWVNISSMSTGDCLALLQDRYLLPQLRWFRVPICETENGRKMMRQMCSRMADLKMSNVLKVNEIFFNNSIIIY